MHALIRADWILSRRAITWALPFLVFLAFAGGKEIPSALMAGYEAAWLAVLVPLYQDLSPASMEPLRLALPLSRPQIVTARYLSVLLAVAAGLIFSALLLLLRHLLGPSAPEPLRLADLASGFALLGPALCALAFLYLPFHFRFEGDRRLGAFALAFVGCAALLLVRFGWQPLFQRGLTWGTRVLERPSAAWTAFGAFLLLALVSWRLSIWSYRPEGALRRAPAPLPFLLVALAFAGALFASGQ